MKHSKKLMALILAIGLIFTAGCETNQESADSSVQTESNVKRKTYEINVDFQPDEKQLECTQTVEFTNKTGVDLEEIYFHVYPKAYKSMVNLPVTMDMLEDVYWKGFESGDLIMTEVLVNGESANFSSHKDIVSIMKIDLNESLKSGESTSIKMDYLVDIPPAEDRLGYGRTTFNFGNWYPILVEYTDEGWHLDPYYNIGDPFFSSVSDYHVIITAPEEYIIAHSGTLDSKTNEGGKAIWDISTKDMRDFAWVASDRFMVNTTETNGITVKSYYINADPILQDFTEQYAVDALTTFSNLYGEYPYPEFTVVACDFYTGMEYPGLAMMGSHYYQLKRIGDLERVLAHEIAHQWWYGIIGNNEIDDAWLDEGLATFATGQYYKYNYGQDRYEEYIRERLLRLEQRYPELAKQGFVKSVADYRDFYKYALLNYRNGMLYFYDLEQEFSEEKLLQFLNAYYEANKFDIATPEKFLTLGNEMFGDRFTDVSDRWLYGEN